MRYYVASDIHGFLTPLKDALNAAGYYEDREQHKLLLLGDLFDRGREAVALQEYILDLMSKNEVILIRGNHEDLYNELVTIDKGMPYTHHIENGTYDTALQLTGFDRALAPIRRYDFAEVARATLYYKTIVPAMLDYYETKHYIFTHGWIPCVKERNGSFSYIENWREAGVQEWGKARWYNGMVAAQTATVDDKVVVCGHWHASFGHSRLEQRGTEFGADADFSPYYGKGIIAIDACTAHTGMVNCIVLEDDELLENP